MTDDLTMALNIAISLLPLYVMSYFTLGTVSNEW